jgi:hypothetical protein
MPNVGDPIWQAIRERVVANGRRSVGAARMRAEFAKVEPYVRAAAQRNPFRAAAPQYDPERLRAARRRLAAAEAEKIGADRPRTMSEYRDGLQASQDERLRKVCALQLEMVMPIGDQTGRRNPFVRSNYDSFDGGMPYDLAVKLGRM